MSNTRSIYAGIQWSTEQASEVLTNVGRVVTAGIAGGLVAGLSLSGAVGLVNDAANGQAPEDRTLSDLATFGAGFIGGFFGSATYTAMHLKRKAPQEQNILIDENDTCARYNTV